MTGPGPNEKGSRLPASDAELVERCRRGERAAWAQLYETYARDVELYLVGVLGLRYDVEDLVQQVFLELLASLSRFRGEAGLRTWVHRIASNLAKKNARRAAYDRRRKEAWGAEAETTAVSGHQRLEAVHDLERVQDALATLDLKFREVWVMRELEELSVEEVAEALELRPATVRTRHHRARKHVLTELESETRVPGVWRPADAGSLG